jgi:acetyl esterase/lipase
MPRKFIFSLAITILIAFGLGVGTVVAFQKSSSVKAAVGTLLSERGARIERGIAYGPEPRHRLDVYRPGNGTPPKGPVVLFLYGGGWRQGDRAMYRFIGAGLASRGFTTVVPDYRLFPDVQFPAFVEDAARAYGWVADHLKSANGRPRDIIVMGHSAGAHIGALMTLDKRYLAAIDSSLRQPAGFIGISGPYAFDPTTWHTTKNIFAEAPSADDARPAAFARADAPPMLVMHGLDDTVVKLWNMQTLTKELRAKGARITPIELADIGHIEPILTMAWPLRWRAPVFDETLSFVNAIAERQPPTAR